MALFTAAIENLGPNGSKSFEEIKNVFTNAPFHLSIKEDRDEPIYMVSFTDESDLQDPLSRECNGLIVDKRNNKVIHSGFSKCYSNDNDPIEIDFNEPGLFIEPMVEGSIVKLFWIPGEGTTTGKWHWATSRHTDASRNFWASSKSFKDLIDEVINNGEVESMNLFYKDTNVCSTFVLQHQYTLNSVQVPKLVLLTTTNLETMRETSWYTNKYPVTCEEDIKKHCDGLYPLNAMLYRRTNGTDPVEFRFKLLNPVYKRMNELRGNDPDIRVAYLLASESDRIEMYKMFPWFHYVFMNLESRLNWLIDNLTWFYRHNYILKETHFVPPRWRKALYNLHGMYLNSRIPIRRDIVCDYINEQAPRVVLRLIELPIE